MRRTPDPPPPAGRGRAWPGRAWRGATRLVLGHRAAHTRPLFATLAVLLVMATGAASGTRLVSALFTVTKSVASNSFTTGTVNLTDDDGGAALLTLTNAVPANTASGCVRITYTGTPNAQVHLYASVTGTGLGTYLDTTITRGTISSPAFPSCTNFTADASTYAAANGVMYSGTLGSFASTYTNYSNGLVDPVAGSPATWTNNTTHAYKITVTVQNNTSAQGLTVTPTFFWEAVQQ